MKIKILTIFALLSFCACNNTPIETNNATNYDIIDRCELGDSTHLLIVNNENGYTPVLITQSQYNTLKSLKKFTITYVNKGAKNCCEVTGIAPLANYDTTTINRQLFSVESKDIEDFKRKTKGSYTIVEIQNNDGMIVVKTPSQEISNMLRLDDFKFFYYKNWEGKYCFDHIETPEN